MKFNMRYKVYEYLGLQHIGFLPSSDWRVWIPDDSTTEHVAMRHASRPVIGVSRGVCVII